MNIDIHNKVEREDRPLVRADVERFLREAGSSDKLNLTGRNLERINLTGFSLQGANLSGANLGSADLSATDLSYANLGSANLFHANLFHANLGSADLSGAELIYANLGSANLRSANLSAADLSYANLSGADLNGVHLSKANLFHAYLISADLSAADLSYASLSAANLSYAHLSASDLSYASLGSANLFNADLSGAILGSADLSSTNLSDANLSGANLSGANLSDANLSDAKLIYANLSDAKGLDVSKVVTRKSTSIFRIRIMEEPLTPHNLTSIISAITELSTKYWLIGNRRFADLIEYTQTRDVRFIEESQLTITEIKHNSPLDASFKIDLTPLNFAEAITTTIDGVRQAKQRLEKAELENAVKVQEIEYARQKADQESKAALFEQERQELANERDRLEILEKRLDVQKKGIEYALEIATKTVTVLYPYADEQTKAMLMQTLLPNILQLQNSKGLELVLPAPQSGGEETETIENG